MKSIITLIFLFFSSIVYSQDLIIKKDNSKILCNILQADSLIIHYQTYKDGKSNFDVVDRKDVLKFYIANPDKLNDPKQIKVIGEKSKKFKEKIIKEKQGFDLGLISGFSKPVRYFAEVSATDILAGNAMPGPIFGIQGIFKITPILGFKVVFQRQINNYDNETELTKYAFNIENFNYSSNPWKQNSFLFGANLSIPIFGSKKFFIELNGLAGFTFAKSYGLDLRYKLSDWNYDFIYDIIHEPSSDFSNVFNFGLGFRFKISKNFAIIPEADYWMSKFNANVKVTQNTEQIGLNSISYSYSSNQFRTNKIRSFNFKIALIYTLRKKENNKIPQ